MISRIKEELKHIEDEYDLSILHACESGSRAWGFPSPDSDYDIRFIYIKPMRWYLSIDKKRDTLTFPVDGALDIGGWDIRKVLQHSARPNPVVCEWLQSPISYLPGAKIRRELFALAEQYYSQKVFIHHYLGTARNAMKSLDDGNRIGIKKFFYVLRPLLAASWVARYDAIPPMELSKLITQIEDTETTGRITELVRLKASSREASKINLDPTLKLFVTDMRESCLAKEEALEHIAHNADILDEYFARLLERFDR